MHRWRSAGFDTFGVTMYSLIYFGENEDDYDTLIFPVSLSVTFLYSPVNGSFIAES